MKKIMSMARIAVCVALTCSGELGAAAETIQRTVPADARGAVEIVNTAGEVRVQGWDRNEVQVSGELGGGVDRLDLRSGDRRTSINVVPPPGERKADAAELVVKVPRNSALSISTVSADQIVTDLRGAQRLQAVSGNITTEQWLEDVEARTISGDVEIRGHGGRGETIVNTVSGEIALVEAPEQLSLETVTGDMKVSAEKLDRARIRTTNGDLRLTATLTAAARLDTESINGDLQFLLREPVNAQFDVETFNGDIVNCFGPKPMRTREFAPGNALRFTQGEGDARVRVKALNGRVEICNR
jgi:DUF4097 and DUF4098 domain-containing protein YvlB